jgi:hypothetical protein
VVTVELRLDVSFEPEERTAVVALSSWWYSASSSVAANPPIERQLHTLLDPLLFVPATLIALPDTDDGHAIAVLSVKVLTDGSVVLYVEPTQNLVIAGGLAHLDDTITSVIVP